MCQKCIYKNIHSDHLSGASQWWKFNCFDCPLSIKCEQWQSVSRLSCHLASSVHHHQIMFSASAAEWLENSYQGIEMAKLWTVSNLFFMQCFYMRELYSKWLSYICHILSEDLWMGARESSAKENFFCKVACWLTWNMGVLDYHWIFKVEYWLVANFECWMSTDFFPKIQIEKWRICACLIRGLVPVLRKVFRPRGHSSHMRLHCETRLYQDLLGPSRKLNESTNFTPHEKGPGSTFNTKWHLQYGARIE